MKNVCWAMLFILTERTTMLKLGVHLVAGSHHLSVYHIAEFLERAKNYDHLVKEGELLLDPQ